MIKSHLQTDRQLSFRFYFAFLFVKWNDTGRRQTKREECKQRNKGSQPLASWELRAVIKAVDIKWKTWKREWRFNLVTWVNGTFSRERAIRSPAVGIEKLLFSSFCFNLNYFTFSVTRKFRAKVMFGWFFNIMDKDFNDFNKYFITDLLNFNLICYTTLSAFIYFPVKTFKISNLNPFKGTRRIKKKTPEKRNFLHIDLLNWFFGWAQNVSLTA
jgi:hypothetical protein